MYKISSYNVNGIRAALRKGLMQWLGESKPDIFCIQETKAQPEQLDYSKFHDLGYSCYIHSAVKKGYSGVAVLTKEQPKNVVYGMGIEKYDNEGRVIRADYEDFTLINAYFPSGTTGGVRQEVKMQFLDDMYSYIQELSKTQPNIILSGDFNICHKPIDINHPERHHKTSGFLPEEREWMTQFLNLGFIDSFRYFDSSPGKYTWWSYRARAREKNLGWRIDYHIVSNTMENTLENAAIHDDAYHSDHCPISVEIG